MGIYLPESVACMQLSIDSRYHIDLDSASLHHETLHEGTRAYLPCKVPENYPKGGRAPAKCRPWRFIA